MKKAIQIVLVQVMVIVLFATPAFSKSPMKVVKEFVKAAKTADFKKLAKLSCKNKGPFLTVSDAQKLDLSDIGLIQKIVREEKSEVDPKRLHIVVARVSFLGKMGFGSFFVFKTKKGWKVHVSGGILKDYPMDELPVSETVLEFYYSNKIYLDTAIKLAHGIGKSYKRGGNYNESINAFKKAIKIKPDDYEAYRQMGIAYRKKRNYDKAMKLFNKALELNPDYHMTYHSIGIAYRKKGEYDNAIEAYKKAINLKPDYYKAYNNIGNVYKDKGEYGNSIMFYKKALEINPDYSKAKKNLVEAEKKRRE